jgi:heat shock protein 4
MSVLGIDLGNENSVIMIARKRGLDLAVNQSSNRKTPTMVGFAGPGEARNIGERAKMSMMGNIPTTVRNVKQYIGKDEKEITDRERNFQMCPIVSGDREVGFSLPVDGELKTFNATEVCAMMFQDLRDIAEAECGTRTTDMVVAFPGYWTDRQRHALRDAARMVGFKTLRMVSEHAACVMAYGCNPKRDLPQPTEEAKVVVMLDVGGGGTQCSMAKFHRGKATVVGFTHDEEMGGRDFDLVLFNHFADEFKEKFKIDIRSNKKAKQRLMVACEAAKLRLSANVEATINCECIMEDTDVRGKITRDEFEEMTKPLLEKLLAITQKIIAQTGNPTVHSVELMGGASRIPAIENMMRENFPKPEGQEEEVLARSLILQDPVARGCALVAAQCSPLFKLFEFNVTDLVVHPVAFSWLHLGSSGAAGEDDDEADDAEDVPMDDECGEPEEKTMTLFERCTANPSSKLVTFKRKTEFELNSAYVEPDTLPVGASPFIGKFTVSGIPDKMSKIKVKIRMDSSSLIVVEGADMVETEWIEVEEKIVAPPKVEAPAAEEAAAEEAPAAEEAAAEEAPAPDAEMPEAAAEEAAAEEASPAEEDEEKPKTEKKRKKKTKRTPLTVTSQTWAYADKDMQEKVEQLLALESADRLIHDTQDRKNAVESYVYETRDALDMHLKEFVSEDARKTLYDMLCETEDWLYGDGEACTKSEYVSKLKELSDLGIPISTRHREAEARPKAMEQVSYAIESARSFVSSTDEAYAHIEDVDRIKVTEAADAAFAWFNEMTDKQAALSKEVDPAFKAKEAETKAKDLEDVTARIRSKPKPAPPKEEKQEEPAAEAAAPEEGDNPDAADTASMPDLEDQEAAPAAEDPAADMEID